MLLFESKFCNQREFCNSSRKRGSSWNVNPLSITCYWHLICTFLCTTTVIYAHNYTWIENDDRLDCVVGIVFNGKPVATGVWINVITVLTARNPFNSLSVYGGDVNFIRIYSIAGYYNLSEFNTVNCYNDAVCSPNGNRTWVRHGMDHRHSPIHDLMVFTVEVPSEGWKRFPARLYQSSGNRYGHMAIIAGPDDVFSKELMYAGFGYIDRIHIKENVQLEMEVISETIIEDCDEWIPRRWGYFICISNVNNFHGISAGTPLLSKGFLFGIASFTLHKNNETIFVFTDLRKYFEPPKFLHCWFFRGKCYFSWFPYHQKEFVLMNEFFDKNFFLLPNFSFLDDDYWRKKRLEHNLTYH